MRVVKLSRDTHAYTYANIIRAGDVVDVTLHLKRHYQAIQKLSASEYMILSTGEVREYNANGTTKADTLDLVKQSVQELVRVINANADNVKGKGLWLGLTYRENMTDLGKLEKDLSWFIRKLRKEYGRVEYITAVEPQERGAWHAHILIWTKEGSLYIPKARMEALWGHGFAKVQRVKDVDNIGAYLSAYLTNIKDGQATKKGARLHLYPKGMRIWRCSHGVDRPEREDWQPPDRVRDIVGEATPCYAPSPIEIYDDDGKLLDRVKHLQYNMIRQPMETQRAWESISPPSKKRHIHRTG